MASTSPAPLPDDIALPFRATAELHVFGLVRLDGAENAMLARLGMTIEAAKAGLRVRLVAADDCAPHPAQAAWFVADKEMP